MMPATMSRRIAAVQGQLNDLTACEESWAADPAAVCGDAPPTELTDQVRNP